MRGKEENGKKKGRKYADLKSVQDRKLVRKISFENYVSISYKEKCVMGRIYEMVENNCFFLIVVRGVWKKENDLKHCK